LCSLLGVDRGPRRAEEGGGEDAKRARAGRKHRRQGRVCVRNFCSPLAFLALLVQRRAFFRTPPSPPPPSPPPPPPPPMGSGVSKSGRTSVVQRMPKSVINGPSPASPANVPENAGDQSQGGAGEPGGVTPSEAVPDPNSTRIFTGTYNVNSSKFSSSDIKAFLLDHGAMAADIICSKLCASLPPPQSLTRAQWVSRSARLAA
jgi:hypothetical protein